MKRKYERRRPGSALILVVVLTSLLAIVGIMFVMTARIDNMSTSAVVENKELNFAVDSVVAKIKQTLAEDVPGVKHPDFGTKYYTPEYYDYPQHRLDPGKDTFYGTWDDSPFAPINGQYGTGVEQIFYDPDNDPTTLDDNTHIHPGPDGVIGTSDDIALGGGYDDWWLASLEPEVVDIGLDKGTSPEPAYGFRHITDLYGRLAYLFYASFDYRTDRLKDDVLDIDDERISFRNLRARIINPSASILREGEKADADGDGVADSRWVVIPDMKTHKGDDIYAAIRIVDNAAMLNVNTAFMNTTAPEFLDPSHPLFPLFFELFDANTVDGSNQTQINLAWLSRRSLDNGTLAQAADKLQFFRCGQGREITKVLPEYLWNVVWRYNRPAGEYTPFDISDELKMRNRYILNYNKMTSRIERLWTNAYDGGIETPRVYPDHDISGDPDIWFWYSNNSSPDDPCKYDFRHISTTYNIDRIIDPAGRKMFNVNDRIAADPCAPMLYQRLIEGIEPPTIEPSILGRYAQFAANLVDFADDDTDVTVLDTGRYGMFYGFEAQPFITELGMKIDRQPWLPGARNYFAVELYNPFYASINLEDFTLMVGEPADINDPNTAECSISLGGVLEPGQSLVIANDPVAFAIVADANNPPVIAAPCLRFFGDCEPPNKLQPVEDRRDKPVKLEPALYDCWTESYNLYLVRRVRQDGAYIYVDKQPTKSEWVLTSVERYLGRDMLRDWHIVYQDLDLWTNINTLGAVNTTNPVNFIGHNFSLALPNPYRRPDHIDPDPAKPLLRQQLITIGDIPQILTIGPGIDPAGTVGQQLLFTPVNREYEIRLNLQDPLYSNIFQYLTVFDPTKDPIDNDGDGVPNEYESLLPTLDNPLRTPELKVPGRININTAPWFVIAQLPWVSLELASAIVAYRDKLDIGIVDYTNRFDEIRDFLAGLTYVVQPEHIREVPGFASIGELNLVLAGDSDYRVTGTEPDGTDLKGFPDLTPDVIVDDFEERDLIFSRISNLVTVRSDVFTAYILVRIGRDGPQKRVIAILDRSDVYPSASESVGKVKLRSLHPVADPR